MITQLLSIHTTLEKLGYNHTDAKLEYHFQKAEESVTRDKGGLEIHNENSELQIDNTEFHNSLDMKNMDTFCLENREKGKEACNDFISQIVQKGNYLEEPVNQGISGYLKSKMIKHTDTNIKFIPEHPSMHFEPAKHEISFKPDKLNVSWNTNYQGDFNFSYGDFSVYREQKGNVDIQYLGQPRYVPDSYGTRKLDIKI